MRRIGWLNNSIPVWGVYPTLNLLYSSFDVPFKQLNCWRVFAWIMAYSRATLAIKTVLFSSPYLIYCPPPSRPPSPAMTNDFPAHLRPCLIPSLEWFVCDSRRASIVENALMCLLWTAFCDPRCTFPKSLECNPIHSRILFICSQRAQDFLAWEINGQNKIYLLPGENKVGITANDNLFH